MTAAAYRDPVRIYTAQELALMPLSEMQIALKAQEQHVASMQSMGCAARQALKALQGGAQLVAAGKSRHRWKLNGEPIKATVVKQLMRRGFVVMDELQCVVDICKSSQLFVVPA